jgi:two-component system nitrogen regulation response regulator NtrX
MSEAIVMIVDDEEGIRGTLSGIFSDEGFEPVTAASGEEAIRIARETSPDIVLLDVWLSGMDGIQTMRELKEIDQELPVIMISGHANVELAVKAAKIGAYDFLEKPLSMEKVLLTVSRALEK